MDKLFLIRSVFEMDGIDNGLTSLLADCFSEQRFPEGTTIFREGSAADSFYVIVSGEVSITRELGPERKKLLSVLGPGSMLGEMALIPGAKRTATATAWTETRLLKTERTAFLNFIDVSPAAGIKILAGLLNTVMRRLEHAGRELATLHQTGRIIAAGERIESVVSSVQEELLLAMPEAEQAATFLYNEYNNEYDPAAAPANAASLPPDNALIARLNEICAGLIINTLPAPGTNEMAFLSAARSLLAMPIIKDSKTCGFILVWDSRSAGVFTNDHLLLASSVAAQLAEAAENLRHRQEERDRRRLYEARQNY